MTIRCSCCFNFYKPKQNEIYYKLKKKNKILIYTKPILFNGGESSKVMWQITHLANKPGGERARGEGARGRNSQGVKRQRGEKAIILLRLSLQAAACSWYIGSETCEWSSQAITSASTVCWHHHQQGNRASLYHSILKQTVKEIMLWVFALIRMHTDPGKTWNLKFKFLCLQVFGNKPRKIKHGKQNQTVAKFWNYLFLPYIAYC